jgi:hypothetical protein
MCFMVVVSGVRIRRHRCGMARVIFVSRSSSMISRLCRVVMTVVVVMLVISHRCSCDAKTSESR